MTEKPENIVKGLVEEFKNNPSVIAFTLVGSQARDSVYTATAQSDMEAFVITEDDKADEVEESLPKIIGRFGNVLFHFKHEIGFVAVYDDLFQIELPVKKRSEMKELFSRPKAQVVKVLLDKTNGELEQILEARPETVDFAKAFESRMINFWYWQVLGARYFTKGEIYNARAVVGIHASTVIKMFELLNDSNILLLETNKRIEKFLTKEQLKQLAELSPTYDRDQILLALRRSMEITPALAQQIKNKYGYQFDETLESKIKPLVLNLLK